MPKRLCRLLVILSFALLLGVAFAQPPLYTDPANYPKPWPSGFTTPTVTGTATYNSGGDPQTDPAGGSGGDATTGGTNPSSFVDVVDDNDPAVFYSGDGETIFVEIILNGPPLALTGASQPYKSATWTMLLDVDGDAYKDFAIMLSGIDSNPQPDDIIVMYSDAPTQALDPATDTIWRQDSAKHPTNSNNVDGEPDSSSVWDTDTDPYIWDFGRTRVTQLDTSRAPGSNLSTYALAMQIPVAALDATSLGGPKLTATSTFAVAYGTANSNNNPAQKDFIGTGDYTFTDVDQPLPFGDIVDPSGNTYNRPSIPNIEVGTCSTSTTLSADVISATEIWSGGLRTTAREVEFQYYRDLNADGVANDSGSWTSIGTVEMTTATATSTSITGGTVTNNLGPWNTTWNPTGLPKGQYLVRAFATNSQGTVTDSTDTIRTDPPDIVNDTYNPATEGTTPIVGTYVNTCGAPPPSVTKSANPTQPTIGDPVEFTITVNNTLSTDITVSEIQDALPPGFSYVSTGSGTLGTPNTTPAGSATGTLSWTFSPAATVSANSSATLIFTANAANTVGSYSNTASAVTSEGSFDSPPVSVNVGSPRLSISKTADVTSADPGDPITYTIRYANDSPLSITNAVITDTLPDGLTFDPGLATGGGTYDTVTNTITWAIGSLEPNSEAFTVSFVGTVDTPYPDTAPIPMVNTANITSDQTTPASSSVSTFINAPRPNLLFQKSAPISQISPGGSVTFTLTYENVGNAAASNVVISDTIPAGFTFTSATGGGTLSSGTVTWNIGSVAAGAGGSVTLELTADPYDEANPNPITNTASIDSDQTPLTESSYSVGVIPPSTGVCTTGIERQYYFRQAASPITVGGSVGTTTNIANFIVPGASDATVTQGVIDVGNTLTEIARFYQDPVQAGTSTLSSDTVTTTLYVDKNGSPQAAFSFELFAYDPTTGNSTSLGTSTGSSVTGNRTNELITVSLTPNAGATIPDGYRLLWVVSAITNNTQNTNNLFVNFNSTTSPSNSVLCINASAAPVLDKTVNNLVTSPGGTLSYTIEFANSGQTTMTNSVITDTLPAGVTFSSATLDGAAVTPSVSGQILTFNNIGGADGLTSGETGTLVINVNVNSPLASGITSLDNIAELTSEVTDPITSNAVSVVKRPNTSINKTADQTLLVLGDVVTFTLTALNSGDADATNVTIEDVLPVAAYFTYVPGSTTLNGGSIPDSVTGSTLSVNAGTLAPGAAATVTFQMVVATTGVPSGETLISNTATVADAQTAGTRSSSVDIAITSNPILRLTKTASANTPPLEPEGLITYTLTLNNVGGSAAEGVLVSDVIPANTTFANGSISYQGTTQSDPNDGDVGAFDAVNNRVIYEIASVGAGSSLTMTFQVRVNALPAGPTTISNTATVAAANAAGRTATATIDATATPDLNITKSALDSFPYPYATATAASSGTTLTVDSTALVVIGAPVSVNGTVAKVTGVDASTNQVTLDTAVSASNETQILPIVTYSLTISNTGNADATNVTITDTLPANMTFVSATPTPVSGSTVTWDIGTLAQNSASSITILALPTQQGEFSNVASVQSDQTVSEDSNTVVTNVGQLLVSKVTNTPSVAPGADVTYVITIENPRTDVATGVRVRDVLPKNFTYTSTTSFGGTGTTRTSTTNPTDPTAGDTDPTWGVWEIAGGGNLTITFVATVGASVPGGIYDNDVEATSDNIPVAPFFSAATTAEDVQVVTDPGNLALTKGVCNITDDNPASCASYVTDIGGAPGDVLEYRITYVNDGAAAITAVVIEDTISGFTTLEENVYNSGASDLTVVCPGGSPVIFSDLTTGTPTITVDLMNVCAISSLGPSEGGEILFRVRIQ